MLGWTDIAPTLLALVTDSAKDLGLPSSLFSAEWREGAQGAINDEQRLAIRMKVTSVVGIGEDEIRYDEDNYATVTGQRKFTVQIMAITTERTDGIWSMSALDRIRTRLIRPRNTQALSDIEISIIDIRQAVKANFRDGGRSMSAAVMDIVFGGVVNDTDPIPVGWIEAVEFTSHIADTDGIEMPAPPNFVALVPEGFETSTPTGGTRIYTTAGGFVVIGADTQAIHTGN